MSLLMPFAIHLAEIGYKQKNNVAVKMKRRETFVLVNLPSFFPGDLQNFPPQRRRER
jgi:hypothetical protein